MTTWNTVGRALTYAIALSAVALFCSAAGMALTLLAASGGTPGAATELHASASLAAFVTGWGFLGSFGTLGASTVTYGVWSALTARRRRLRTGRASVLGRPRALAALLFADGDNDLDAYERRVRRSGAALLCGGFLLAFLADLLGAVSLPS